MKTFREIVIAGIKLLKSIFAKEKQSVFKQNSVFFAVMKSVMNKAF